ncbi:MAG: MotA/TolQ/ExbB proton channel family protein [Planctomycetales bacterium]|nr:MotA/TolQ/ExbB proton channel family protein [Planctomycetales bacterium]
MKTTISTPNILTVALTIGLLGLTLANPHAGRGDQPAGGGASGDSVPATARSAAFQVSSQAASIAERNLIHIIHQGGPLMVPILICSFILLIFTFERLFSLRRRRVIPKPFVRRFLHQLSERSIRREEALELCHDNGSPVARVFAGAVQKWGRPAVEVEQGIIDAGERVSNGLRRYLRLLNGVATVSPLLGLLGTVLGMIQAFNDIATADAMGKPELLAAGIGQALITTASGLTVAIPALIFYMFFLSRVDRLVMDIDALAQKVVAEISAESRESRAKKKQAA